MLYIIIDSYCPGTAGMNRVLSYLKKFSEEGIDTTMVFIYPDDKMRVVESPLPHIRYRYLWKEHFFSRKKIIEIFLRKIYPLLFKRCLKHGDIVFTYGCGEFQHYIIGVKGVRYYHERTEHPLAIGRGKGNPLTRFPLETYYKDCRKLDGMFVISTCLKDYFTSVGVPLDKVHIINMTVDPSRFEGVVKKDGERYLAYCGVIFNDKDGVDLLVESFAKVSDKYPDVKLYIIGPVPESLDNNAIVQLIKRLGLESRVVLTGRVPAENMPQLLKNAELCLLNRPDGLRAKAGFPTKLGEYLLTENPVVVTKVGDIPLFLEDGVSALLSEPNNPTAFAEKIDWALSHKEEAREIGKRGSMVAMQSFNAAIETQKIINTIFK